MGVLRVLIPVLASALLLVGCGASAQESPYQRATRATLQRMSITAKSVQCSHVHNGSAGCTGLTTDGRTFACDVEIPTTPPLGQVQSACFTRPRAAHRGN
jgi:hypothetical protein